MSSSPIPPELHTRTQPGIKDNGHLPISTWADMAEMFGPIEWAWERWMAHGFLSALVSSPGEGKSAVALYICGCFINAWSWPDGNPFTGETGSVLWLEAEAGQAIHLERARGWSLPLERFIAPLGDPSLDISLDNKAHREIITKRATLAEVRLIVVDSLSGSSRRKENDTEILAVLQWLATLARDTGKPVLLTHHLNKRREFDNEQLTLDRVRGSSSITQFARTIWALSAPDPAQPNRKRLEQLKNNLSRFPKPVGFTIGDHGINFGEAPEAPKKETAVDRAAELLYTLLAAQPMESKEIEEQAKGAGISHRSIYEAKKRLGIVAIRKENVWFWSFPPRLV